METLWLIEKNIYGRYHLESEGFEYLYLWKNITGVTATINGIDYIQIKVRKWI